MSGVNYDFSSFIDTFQKMKNECGATPESLGVLKSELNRFFKDSKCEEVLYTNNIDKMFFGIKILPMIDADDIYDYMVDTNPIRIDKYILELDSHLFSPVLDLDANELTAIILHEVNGIVGDSGPVEAARNVVNNYLAINKDHIRISKSIHYKEVLAYGLKDYLSKVNSLFYTSDYSDIISDEFCRMYDFDGSLYSAYDKIKTNNMKMYQDTEVSKFITFQWTLNIYKNIKEQRIGSTKVLSRAKLLTGSRIEKLEIDNIIRRIKRIDDGDIFNEASGSIKSKIKEKMKKARINNLRTIENTLYELGMQVRNVEDEEDALYLMRQINNTISIVDEYRNSSDCDTYEVDKWNNVYDKYCKLREKLASTVVYRNKNYGIFIQYPDIVENRM